MYLLLATLIVALVFSSVGFKKYVWSISIGYGFSIAAIGIALLTPSTAWRSTPGLLRKMS